MCFKLMNLIKLNPFMTPSQKRFMAMMATYANPDGSSIYPSNETISSDWGINRSTVIRMRNDALRNSYLICVKPSTSKRAAEYIINVKLLEISIKAPVDNSLTIKSRGRITPPLGVASRHPTYHIPFNTRANDTRSVDNLPKDYPPKKPFYSPDKVNRFYNKPATDVNLDTCRVDFWLASVSAKICALEDVNPLYRSEVAERLAA